MKEQEIKKIFGDFEYEDNSNGSITILGIWIKTYIRKIKLGKYTIWCHALIISQLKNIYDELVELDMQQKFDLSNGGGCFVPRHKCWNIKRKLSCHSWGIAVDINPKKYPYGSDKRPPNKLISAFKKNGFIWGGNWRSKDMMHFEFKKFL